MATGGEGEEEEERRGKVNDGRRVGDGEEEGDMERGVGKRGGG